MESWRLRKRTNVGQPDRRIVLPSTIFSGDMFIFAGGSWFWLQIFVQFRMWGPFILSIPTYSKLFPIIQVGYQFIGKPYRYPCARTCLVGMRIIILHFPQQNSLGSHPLKTTTAAGTAKRHPWRLSHGSYGPKMSWHLRKSHKFFFPPHGFSLCLPLFFVGLPGDFFFSGAGIFD